MNLTIADSPHLEWLSSRYPEIYCLLAFGAIDRPFVVCETEDGYLNGMRDGRFLHAQEGIQKELDRFQKKIDLQGVQTCYLYGIGLGWYCEGLQKWLHNDVRNRLVFLEDDPAVLDLALRTGQLEKVLNDPQVELRYIASPRHWPYVIEQCAKDHPSSSIEMLALEAYAKTKKYRCFRLRIELLRKTAMVYTYLTEIYHAHHIHGNLLENIHHIDKAFDANALKRAFEEVPAIICGAGPSLVEALPLLRELDTRAIMFAGGSAVAALGNGGVTPHFSIAFDPNAEEYERFRMSVVQEVPLLYGHRLQSDVFSTCNQPNGYIRSGTGGSAETWMEKKLGLPTGEIGPELGSEALSVTTMGLAMAYQLGCNPIILVGVDLAYSGMKRYAPGVVEDEKIDLQEICSQKLHLEKTLKREGQDGRKLYTLVKWIMEAESIGAYAKKRRARRFINASVGGIRIPYLSHESLAVVVEKEHWPIRDLRGHIHQKIQHHQFSHIKTNSVGDLLQGLKQSMARMHKLSVDMLQEIADLQDREGFLPSGRMTIIEIDFQEEEGFHCFLEMLGSAFEVLMAKEYPLPIAQEGLEYRKAFLARAHAKWTHYLQAIEYYALKIT